MHDQEVRAGVDRPLNRALRRIDRGGNPTDRASVIYLQSVERHRIVRVAVDVQQVVEALGEVDRSHAQRTRSGAQVLSSATFNSSSRCAADSPAQTAPSDNTDNVEEKLPRTWRNPRCVAKPAVVMCGRTRESSTSCGKDC